MYLRHLQVVATYTCTVYFIISRQHLPCNLQLGNPVRRHLSSAGSPSEGRLNSTSYINLWADSHPSVCPRLLLLFSPRVGICVGEYVSCAAGDCTRTRAHGHTGRRAASHGNAHLCRHADRAAREAHGQANSQPNARAVAQGPPAIDSPFRLASTIPATAKKCLSQRRAGVLTGQDSR